MKILFLDFDGVLNSEKWFIDNKDRITESTSLLTRGAAELDPEAIRRILQIIDATGAAVVVSSSWRHLHSMEEILTIFEELGFPEMRKHIIDRTPTDRGFNGVRGKEIHAWIKEFESKNGSLTSFCIIDDDSDMLSSQRSNFVQTSWKTGLLSEDVEKAIRILGETRVPL